jgi:hypothetical protein
VHRCLPCEMPLIVFRSSATSPIYISQEMLSDGSLQRCRPVESLSSRLTRGQAILLLVIPIARSNRYAWRMSMTSNRAGCSKAAIDLGGNRCRPNVGCSSIRLMSIEIWFSLQWRSLDGLGNSIWNAIGHPSWRTHPVTGRRAALSRSE